MNQTVRKLWTDALRSKKYKQGKGRLTYTEHHRKTRKNCCLGVLCDLAVKEGVIPKPVARDTLAAGEVKFAYGATGAICNLPIEVVEWAGLSTSDPFVWYTNDSDGNNNSPLSCVNDAGVKFGEIADLIDAQLGE